ncbi:hypothetical protein KPL76_05030 [Subtercola sp. PAMC28395]|uniref:hypothetical protein n=1 Tax=Subtercola sp. PAMC28395 TaxID=2846775 RepID=UPI001C0C95EA|nr:hypothetical protein [Subtercola sp. PAMC28395]QWT24738.1 hypothetical protein KPL76_05030 [Subtercola sp. PAMC28395]
MLADELSAGHSSDDEPALGTLRSAHHIDGGAQLAELRRAVFGPGTPDDVRDQKAAELAALEKAVDDERHAAELRQRAAAEQSARRRGHMRSLRRKWMVASFSVIVVLAVVGVTSALLVAGRPQPGTLPASDAAASTFPALSPAEAAAQSPAQVFTRPQTSADMPTQGFPVGLVIGSFRLLRTAQFTPTTAFVALRPDGDTCLTVYGTGTDFESKCTLAETALRGGITVVFSTVQNMNPRTGSAAVSSVTFTAEWMPDGQYTVSSAITVAH